MSYLHCPVCSRAFNLAVHSSCPYCPVVATPVEPVDDIVAAADRLARALAQASPSQRAAAAARLGSSVLALTAPASRAAPPRPPLLATLALAVLDRISARPGHSADAVHMPGRLFRAVHARVKALAA